MFLGIGQNGSFKGAVRSVQYGSDAHCEELIQALSPELEITQKTNVGYDLMTRFVTRMYGTGRSYSHKVIETNGGLLGPMLPGENFGDLIGGNQQGLQSPKRYRELTST